MIRCPTCGRLSESARGKCPWCLSGMFGRIGEKRAVQPRELAAKYSCTHGIILCQPCSKCQNSAEEQADYRVHMLAELKTFLITFGIPKEEAWDRAKKLLADIESINAQEQK